MKRLLIAFTLLGASAALASAPVAQSDKQDDKPALLIVWQLLMGGQLPVIAYYAIAHLPAAPRQGIGVLAAQAAAAFAALAPVYILQF